MRIAMMTRPRCYLAFMLRLWRVTDEGGMPWRASLESPHTGERHSFSNLAALFNFLEEHIRGLERQARSQDIGTIESESKGRAN